MSFRNLLFIDTSLNGCVVGVYADGHVVVDRFETSRGQAEKLIPMVQGVLDEAAIAFEALDAIIVSLGPGTFTGIRIGLSAAKTLGMVLDIPVFGISSLQAIALDYAAPCHVVLETKRQDYYFQSFGDAGAALNAAQSVVADEMPHEGVFIGDAVQRLSAALEVKAEAGYEAMKPEAVFRAFLDDERRDVLFTTETAPIYLRAPDVSMPKVPPRKIAQ